MSPANRCGPETEATVTRALRKRVHDTLAVSPKKMPSSKKETALVGLFRPALGKVGQFYRTADKAPFFFRKSERRLYDLDPRPGTDFATLIGHWADITVKRALIGYALDRVRSRASETAEVVEIHAIAYNSLDARVVAINDFGGGMWRRERGGSWKWEPNGAKGLLFWTPGAPVELWKPDFHDADEPDFAWLLEQPHFADDVLNVRDQRMLFRALVLAPFFPSLGRVRPIHAHLGLSQRRQHDTGKTTAGKALGIVFVGPKFEPMPPPEPSEKGLDSLQLELMHKPFVLLDNVDTDIKWLNDFLCTYATGAAPTKRRLYTDTQQVSVEYRARLLLTSRKPTFRRPDTASRTIPFRFAPIEASERKTEWELLRGVAERRGRIWGDILTVIGRIQDVLPGLTPPPPTLRLADFERFGWIVSAAYSEQREWERMIPRLRVAQAGFALQDEPLVPILKRILAEGDINDQKTADFYERVTKAAGDTGHSLDVPRSASACTDSLRELQDALEPVLDVKFGWRVLHGHALISIVRGSSWSEGVSGVRGAPDLSAIPMSVMSEK